MNRLGRILLAIAVGATAVAVPRPGAAEAPQWQQYVLSGDRPAHGVPALVTPSTPATLIWRHEVAGNLELTFGAVTRGTVVKVAFSETAEYLAVNGTSDWSRTYGTDDHAAGTGQTWIDRPGCTSSGICADGFRAFRFARISVVRGSAEIVRAGVRLPSGVAQPTGWFLSSDPALNRIWFAGAYTAQLTQLPGDAATLGSTCAVPAGTGTPLVVDGAKRDRCPWATSLALTELSLFLANGGAGTAAVENTLSLFAGMQHLDGSIPASPMATTTLFDSPAYWVLAVDELMLYRGELSHIASYWPSVVRVLDTWYPAFAEGSGLIDDPFPGGDYGLIQRGGPLVSYVNALYCRALEAGAQIADTLGHGDVAARWRSRVDSLKAPFAATFWDPSAGAFLDSPSGPALHAQDGNAFAILAGLATPDQATAVFTHFDSATQHPWGNALADGPGWVSAPCNLQPTQCVFPFVSYFDVEARFAAQSALSALEELRRTWGWMLPPTPGASGTDWEAIGAGGSVDGYARGATSLAAGWSTGAVAALSNDVLGIRPTGAGFSTFDAIPHPADLAWAEGSVPTPAGPIMFGFRRVGDGFLLRLEAPPGLVARVGAPAPFGSRVLVDGRPVAPSADGTVKVRGSHILQFGGPAGGAAPGGGTLFGPRR